MGESLDSLLDVSPSFLVDVGDERHEDLAVAAGRAYDYTLPVLIYHRPGKPGLAVEIVYMRNRYHLVQVLESLLSPGKKYDMVYGLLFVIYGPVVVYAVLIVKGISLDSVDDLDGTSCLGLVCRLRSGIRE